MDVSVWIREIAFQELALIKPLFRQVFGSDISEEMLAWKYGDGQGRSYGAFAPDGALLAHCGLFYRQVLADGQPCRIAQLGDLMALPGRYGGLSRAGSPFALLIRKVLSDLPGVANPDGLAFGFPSDRAMRLGEHLGLFSSIDQIWELSFGPLPCSWCADSCQLLNPADNNFAGIANRLWQQMAKSLGNDLVGVRDANYLEQRYFRHPLKRYDCYLVSSCWLRRPLGLLITHSDGDQCELLDIIAAPSGMKRVLQAARMRLQSWRVACIKLWMTEQHAEKLQGLAEAASRLEFRIMANPFSSAGNPQRFASRWWLTSGDTDYH